MNQRYWVETATMTPTTTATAKHSGATKKIMLLHFAMSVYFPVTI